MNLLSLSLCHAFYKEWGGAGNAVNSLKKEVNKWKNIANGYANDIKNLEKQVNNLEKEVNAWKDKANKYWRKLSSYEGEIRNLKNNVANWAKKAKDLSEQITSIPNKLKKEVVNPILSQVKQVKDDAKKIDDIADAVAGGAVDVIKQLNFLPKSGAALATHLGDAMLDFMSQDFCVPYDCIAKKFGVDMSDIELYSSENLAITTALTPKTCLQVIDVEFDSQKLTGFLDLFRGLQALEEIFDEVKGYIVKEMKEVIDFADDIEKVAEQIENTAKNAAKLIGLGRRQLLATDQEVDQVTTEHLAAMAYEKGLMRFHELYGRHVNRIFAEQNLAARGGSYIGFKSLKMKLTQDFGQTISLVAEGRSTYSGSLFDESTQKNLAYPVPYTAGLMTLVSSGSIESSMPYSMIMEGTSEAEFKYNVGVTEVIFDIVSGGDPLVRKEPFKTSLDVEGSAGLSGTMSLNFAASASLGLCLGPTQDACITITVDTSQTSAAGFDALAGVNYDNHVPLTPLYTDVLEYNDQKKCTLSTSDQQREMQSNALLRETSNVALHAGYWQYIGGPSVTVALTGTTFCVDESHVLYELKEKILQKSSANFCVGLSDAEEA